MIKTPSSTLLSGLLTSRCYFSTTHLLITNWLNFPINVECLTKNSKEWINPYRPDLTINRILYPYSSICAEQRIRPMNTCYSVGNFGQFSCVIESQKFGRAVVPCNQVNAYGVWSYNLFYGMYSVRHRAGLKFNIYEIAHRDNPENSRWMQMLMQKKPSIKINQITMPGSHDSGMIINRFSFLKRLTQNQYEDILGQLKAGIRYFDIRLTIKSGEYVVYHGNDYIAGLGVTLQSLIVDVNAFLQQYGWNEVIFIAVSKTRKQMKKKDRHKLILKLRNELKNVVVCDDVRESSIVHEQLWKYRGKVVLLYDNHDFMSYEEPVLKFQDMKDGKCEPRSDTLAVFDSYSNTNMIQEMIEDQNTKLQKYGGYGKNYLFLYSFTLTVQSALRLSGQHYSIQLLGNISRARLPIQLEKMKLGELKKPNIIYYDFVDSWSCSAIINLNYN